MSLTQIDWYPDVEPDFELGEIVVTFGALDAAPIEKIIEVLGRHAKRDWGILDPEDAKLNFEAVHIDGRLLSAYPIDPSKPCSGIGENTLWIRTIIGRQTTILLPEEN